MRIDIFPMSNVEHLHQIFVGLDVIGRQEDVHAYWHYDGAKHYGVNLSGVLDHREFCVMIEIDGGRTVCVDVHDSSEIFWDLYKKADLYAKRSYSFVEHGDYDKIIPLGLNLHIAQSARSIAPIVRALRMSRRRDLFIEISRYFKFPKSYAPSEKDLYALPRASADPMVLFMTRAWDPKESKTPSPEKSKQRMYISHFRADCIRALRSEFGDRFIGGIQDSEFARKNFPDVVIPKSDTSKKDYLKIVRSADICITSAGLHGSTGWKFAEYLALGRAIVCEPNAFDLGPGIQAGRNFLEFDSPHACVKKVRSLLENRVIRQEMMEYNEYCFRAYVRPESIVRRALMSAIREL